MYNEVWTPQTSMKSKQKQFELAVVKHLHKLWFPHIGFRAVEKELENDVSWDTYSNLLNIQEGVPDWSFIRDDKLWNLNIHTLLKTQTEKLPLLKHWEEQPSDGLIFPLVATYGLIQEVEQSPDYSHVLKFTKDKRKLCLSTLTDFAKTLHVSTYLGD